MIIKTNESTCVTEFALAAGDKKIDKAQDKKWNCTKTLAKQMSGVLTEKCMGRGVRSEVFGQNDSRLYVLCEYVTIFGGLILGGSNVKCSMNCGYLKLAHGERFG